MKMTPEQLKRAREILGKAYLDFVPITLSELYGEEPRAGEVYYYVTKYKSHMPAHGEITADATLMAPSIGTSHHIRVGGLAIEGLGNESNS